MLYLLRKIGYFYRHNNSGYTESPFEAEVYEEKYALDHEKMHENVTAVPVTAVIDSTKMEEVLERLMVIRKLLK